MLSAASAKLEKQSSSSQAETSDYNNATTPIRQALVIIEHKIRNLEKRKTKLEYYRGIQLTGTELSADQKAAVAKYDEVAQSLEFARELSKQMLHISNVSEKEQRKQYRKEATLRARAEILKIREVLTIQNVLSHFTDADVREDFLKGSNGAAKLEEKDLKILEKFYIDIHVKRQNTPQDLPFFVGAHKAAELLSLAIDGSQKQYGDSTFDNIRRILNCIQECGYLDKAGKKDIKEAVQPGLMNIVNENTNPSDETIETCNENANLNTQLQISQQNVMQKADLQKFTSEAPAAAAVPAPSFPQSMMQGQSNSPLVNTQAQSQPQLQRQILSTVVGNASQTHSVPAIGVATNPANISHGVHFPPTTVRAVEQSYFKHQHQFMQQMRPLADVIGSTNFYFLQESELDSPEIVQSFTTNEQKAASVIKSSTLSPPSPNTSLSLVSQSITQEQHSQHQVISQPGMQSKSVQQSGIPIPSQTFTNQSFPSISTPSTLYPQPIATAENQSSEQPQISVYANQPIAISSLVPQSSGGVLAAIENPPSETICLGNQSSNGSNLISGSNTSKFISNPSGGISQPNQLPANDTFESVQKSHPSNEGLRKKQTDNVKERTSDNSVDWDVDERSKKFNVNHAEEETNQWNNDIANTPKNEWNNNYDNQTESNTWKNLQNENYNSRNVNRSSFGNGNRTVTGRGGVLRGGGTSNGYRGRSNHSYQHQQPTGRNSGMYFRNNDNGFQQNQNSSGYNNVNKQDSTGNYIANSNNVYRARGVSTVGVNKQSNGSRISSSSIGSVAPRNGVNSNRGSVGLSNQTNRGSRNSGHVSTYGSTRQSNIRQQDINA